MKKCILFLIFSAVCLIAGRAAPAQVGKGGEPPPPANSIAITTASWIGSNGDGSYTIWLLLNFTVDAARPMQCYVYDENSDSWQCAVLADNKSITYTTGEAGTGSITFHYNIASNTAWATAIANSTYPQAWCMAAVLTNDFKTIIAQDSEWVYKYP